MSVQQKKQRQEWKWRVQILKYRRQKKPQKNQKAWLKTCMLASENGDQLLSVSIKDQW